MRLRLVLVALALPVLLSACVRLIPSTASRGIARPPVPQPVGGSAMLAGLARGPAVKNLNLGDADARAALSSFRESCPRLTARNDASGLTRPSDWQAACAAAPLTGDTAATRFFAEQFETIRVADGKAYATGYYEPEIAGSRTRIPGYDVPVYGLPGDLVRAWPETIPPEQRSGNPPLGRIDESGKPVPYWDRAAIEDGALMGKGLEIAWAADPIEFFFLQIQGSGRLRAPDGTVMRIGYAGQNGQPYAGLGSLMRERGLIGEGPGQYPGSMQGIMSYLREHPVEGHALMRENKSWVFFRELAGDGPIGALGVPVRRRASVAADPQYVPLGAPVWLSVDRPEVGGLWIAQDTGGAIKGANRFDTFWGAGAQAAAIAGGMSGSGVALILLPKGTIARAQARP
jgi:membrane-bound lytic murein transglycosylase A